MFTDLFMKFTAPKLEDSPSSAHGAKKILAVAVLAVKITGVAVRATTWDTIWDPLTNTSKAIKAKARCSTIHLNNNSTIHRR